MREHNKSCMHFVAPDTDKLCNCGAAKSNELETLAAPLIGYLYKYGCPHSCIIITQTSAELLSGEVGIPFEPRD